MSHHLTLHKCSAFSSQLTFFFPSNKSLISFSPFIKSGQLGVISWLLLYFSKGPPLCSLLVSTLNPIEYSTAVLLYFTFALPLISYKARWELWIPINPLEGRTHQQRSHQWVKPKYNKRAHSNRRKGNPKVSRQRDQKDCTTESHKSPTIETHTTKTASKVEHQEQ